MQGYNLEIRHIPGKRNPADTLSRQDIKDALGRKTAVHDANADLVRELRVPSDADDSAIQEALMKLFNAQVQEQIKSQSETVSDAVEGQASRAKRSVEDQALKASDTIRDQISSSQSSSVQPKSVLKPSSSNQFSSSVPVSASSNQDSQCTIAVARSSVTIDNSLRDRMTSLLRNEILYRDIFDEIESTGRNEIVRGQEKYRIQKKCLSDSCHWTTGRCAVLENGCSR